MTLWKTKVKYGYEGWFNLYGELSCNFKLFSSLYQGNYIWVLVFRYTNPGSNMLTQDFFFPHSWKFSGKLGCGTVGLATSARAQGHSTATVLALELQQSLLSQLPLPSHLLGRVVFCGSVLKAKSCVSTGILPQLNFLFVCLSLLEKRTFPYISQTQME